MPPGDSGLPGFQSISITPKITTPRARLGSASFLLTQTHRRLLVFLRILSKQRMTRIPAFHTPGSKEHKAKAVVFKKSCLWRPYFV